MDKLHNQWCINFYGECLCIAYHDTPIDELKSRNQYVVGFKGFEHHTTPAKALRFLRPYGGKSCYIHNKIFYIGFENEKDMQTTINRNLIYHQQRLVGRRLGFNKLQPLHERVEYKYNNKVDNHKPHYDYYTQ